MTDKPVISDKNVNRSYINDLMVSVQRSKIKTTLISLAWTAGPVTVIAIILGYYFSHGVLVPYSTLIYFSIYVFIVGISSLLSKIILDAKKIRQEEETEQTFLNVIEASHEKLKQARNLKLTQLDYPLQQEMISTFLLSKSHPSPSEIFFAMKGHFGKEVARYAELMQIYENNGIPAEALSISNQLHQAQQQILSQENLSDNLKTLALRKVKGDHISLNEGSSRSPGFLSKILNSGGQLSLFDTDDASNIITLCLELLTGRTIYFFKTRTNFDSHQVDRLFNQIENTRQKLRLKHWQAYGLLEQMYSTLGTLPPEIPLKPLIQIRLDVQTNILTMQKYINSLSCTKFKNGNNYKFKALNIQFEQIKTSIHRNTKRLDDLMKHWHKLENTPRNILDDDNVEVKLATIQLDENERLKLADKLKEFIEKETNNHTESNIKSFAQFIVKQLLKPLNLENPLIVYAIEVSHAANFSSIEANYSAKQKAQMTHNLSKTVYANIRQLKKRFRQNLVAQYQNYKHI
jgi:hypothetical protein